VVTSTGLENRDVAAVTLWWIPVGAGGHVVRRTSSWWERIDARRAGRPPGRLFHAALEVTVDGTRSTIEMAPAWGVPPGGDRGVVCTGPVGFRWLERWRLFRYEVRCWPQGVTPDLTWAEGGPTQLTDNPQVARVVLDSISRVPRLVWGRVVPPTGDMWNSNSLVAWLLREAGIDTSRLRPPEGGRAPGWEAGLALAGEKRRALAPRA
jgi:hypothetical protein